MKKRLLEILICSKCKNHFSLYGETKEGSEIKEGLLKCEKCSREFRVRKYIPRFVESDLYLSSFSFEWNRWKRVQLDIYSGNKESEKIFVEKTGIMSDEVKGKLVLDVGCGAGRFAEVVSRWGGEVICVDLSFAVDAVLENIGMRENVHLIQADIFHLPFKEETFDIVYSIGVLHHTPDTKEAFMHVLPYVKRRGKLAVWVYSRHCMWPFKGSEFLRKITPKLPKRLLYYLSAVSVPLYFLYQLPPIKLVFYPLLPIDMKPHWKERWLDTFDWYSPEYQWKHTYPEVYNWFVEAGFNNIRLLNTPVAIVGEKRKCVE